MPRYLIEKSDGSSVPAVLSHEEAAFKAQSFRVTEVDESGVPVVHQEAPTRAEESEDTPKEDAPASAPQGDVEQAPPAATKRTRKAR